MGNLESLVHAGAEGLLAAAIVALLLAGLVVRQERNVPALFYPLGIAVLAATLLLELSTADPATTRVLFQGMLRSDGLGHLFKLICLFSGILFLVLSLAARETSTRFTDAAEYVVLTLTLCLGMMLLVASNNLLMFYLGMELLSFPSYLLTGLVDRDERTTEAAVKYLLYGAVASGVMIYGMSLLYGLTGSLDFGAVSGYLAAHAVSGPMLFISLAFIAAGLGFKIAAFPFHLWSPDVYEGAPTAFSAFLSVGPKAAGFGILLRVLFQLFSAPGPAVASPLAGVDWAVPVAIVSALSMTVGNLAALPQRNIKRLLAYSSIAHAGYALMPLVGRTAFGVQAAVFYLAVYLLMNVAAFLVAIIIANEHYTERLEGYEGLGWKGPQGVFLATALTIALFSLAGIPPFAGFIGKVYLLLAVVETGPAYYWLAVVAVVNTVISLYYYTRIVKLMFLSRRVKGAPLPALSAGRALSYAVLAGLTALTLLFGVYWKPLSRLSGLALSYLK